MPGEIYALFGAMLFGCSHTAVRKAHDDGWTTHTVLLTITVVNLLCFLAGLLYTTLAGRLPPIYPSALAFFALAGVFTVLLGRLALFSSIARLGAARAASYRITSPLATVSLAYLWLGERLSPGSLLGAAVVILGVWLLTRETSRREASRPALGRKPGALAIGIALGLISAACFGTGQVFRKVGLDITSAPVLGTFVGSLVATLLVASGALRGGQWREMLAAHRARFGWPMAAAGLITAVAQFSIFYSYERARVSTASVLGATEPVWTFVAASLLMRRQEAPTWSLAASILIIIGGAALVVSGG